ncbi:MAG: hypothetical protein BGO31_09195 [Bacteroidetes bacterium 43-16]|nr:MAG: hypothetical protein BGO31_09195 [Bacteroidetes bacterium 43-16]
MKINKHLITGIVSLCMLMNGCSSKENNAGNRKHTPEIAEVFSQAPNERIVSNNGIHYTIRFMNEVEEGSDADTLPRYLFVIDQKTDQGKNVLEYEVSDLELYARRLNYYNIEMNQDILLIACGDTLTPVQTLYENNLGVIPVNRIVTVFKKVKENCALQLVFSDRAFENYLIKATFNDK